MALGIGLLCLLACGRRCDLHGRGAAEATMSLGAKTGSIWDWFRGLLDTLGTLF